MQAYSWRPIESAPRDGTRIIALEGDGDVILADFYEGQWYLSLAHDPIEEPAHWMPLPEPPSDTLR